MAFVFYLRRERPDPLYELRLGRRRLGLAAAVLAAGACVSLLLVPRAMELNLFGMDFLHRPERHQGECVTFPGGIITGENPLVLERDGARFHVVPAPDMDPALFRRGHVLSIAGMLEGDTIHLTRAYRNEKFKGFLSAGILAVFLVHAVRRRGRRV